MNRLSHQTTILLVTGIMAFSGCAAFRANVRDVDTNKEKHFDQKFDYSDLHNFTRRAANQLAATKFKTKPGEKPVFMIAGIQNRTSEYVDGKNLTDRIRTILFKTGKFRFVNVPRRADLMKEQKHQAANATTSTRVAIGKQLGAGFMLSGSLTEMKSRSPDQVRISRKKVSYYKLTLEVTDLTTGELLWTDEQELARQASQPIIRW